MAPRTYTLDRAGSATNAASDRELMRALAQSIIKINATGVIPKMTDNSGGVVGTTSILFPTAMMAIAASGSNLAAPADVATNLGTVRNAIKTLFTKANTAAAAIGLAMVAYGGGGTDGAGTIAAISTAVSGAATGPQDVESNAIIASYNDAIYNLGRLIDRVCEATGDSLLKLNPSRSTPPLGTGTLHNITNALPVSTAVAAASPGISAAAWNATFLNWASILATMAAALNNSLSAGAVRVIPVR